MAFHTNWASLEKELLSKANATLKDNVFQDAKGKLVSHAQSDILDVYNPKMYERKSSGGIDDPENVIYEETGENEITVMNIAEPSPSVLGTPFTPNSKTVFSQWINDGEVYPLWGNAPYTEERPFVDNATEEIKSTKSHVKAMKEGLRQRGIQTD